MAQKRSVRLQRLNTKVKQAVVEFLVESLNHVDWEALNASPEKRVAAACFVSGAVGECLRRLEGDSADQPALTSSILCDVFEVPRPAAKELLEIVAQVACDPESSDLIAAGAETITEWETHPAAAATWLAKILNVIGTEEEE